MTFSQAALARELGVSEMTMHRLLKTLGRNGARLTDVDVLTVLIVGEMQDLDIQAHRAIHLLAALGDEIRYVAASPARRCWIVFCDSGPRSFELTAMSRAHLESILDAFPLSITLPLHQLAAQAQERLDGMKARLEAAA